MKRIVMPTIFFLLIVFFCKSVEANFYDDNDFDGSDLVIFVAEFNNCNSECNGDFVRDGDVDQIDLGAFASNFGKADCILPEIVKEIGPEGGDFETLDGSLRIEIPPGTFDETNIFTVSSTGKTTEIGDVYDVRSSAETFNASVTVSIAYDPQSLPDGVSEDYVYIVSWKDDSYEEMLADIVVDQENHIVTGRTTHFSSIAGKTLVNTGVRLENVPITTDFRMPIGDDAYNITPNCDDPASDSDLGDEIDRLTYSYYDTIYNGKKVYYPKIQFNYSDESNRWYVGTAHRNNLYLLNDGAVDTGKLGDYGSTHVGEDWKLRGDDAGRPVYAIADGTIVFKQYQGPKAGFGHIIVIAHRLNQYDIVYSVYGHLASSSPCNVGDNVLKGDSIGIMGTTGKSTGIHLHFEIDKKAIGSINSEGEILLPSGWIWPSNDDDRTKYYYEPTSFIRNIMGSDDAPDTGKTEWAFNIPYATENWFSNDLENSSVSGGFFNINPGNFSDPANPDPYIHISPLKIPANLYQKISIKMSINATNKNANIYFITDSEPKYSEDKKISFTLEDDADMHEYIITACETENPSKWDGNIIGLRLDPTSHGIDESDEDNVYIDHILILKETCGLNPVNGPIPDTGQTTSYTNTFGEDSDYTINPHSYTKMDASGNDLPDNATAWPMVRDNVTGLIWENKTDDGTIHDKDNTYNWQNAQDILIAQLNAANFGGYSDWRLPTLLELSLLVYAGKPYPGPTINTTYFLETALAPYWSSSTVAGFPDRAWRLHFSNGVSDASNYTSSSKSFSCCVRAVRGGSFSLLSSLIDNGDGTVTDTQSGLMWQKTEAGAMNWEAALTYCESLDFAGHDDWRLPNRNELQSLVDYAVFNPAIDTVAFPGALSSNYWSSSTHAFKTGSAWLVDFSYGGVNYGSVYVNNKFNSYYVRAVRGGQPSVLE
jgi:murein DD-endopeptidase MepM/ murein hydrolase activator NlpD